MKPSEMFRKLQRLMRSRLDTGGVITSDILGKESARATSEVLELLKIPTAEMIAAGAEEANWVGASPEEKARQIWTAMIGAAQQRST